MPFFHCAIFVRLSVRQGLLATLKKEVTFILGRKPLLPSKTLEREYSRTIHSIGLMRCANLKSRFVIRVVNFTEINHLCAQPGHWKEITCD